MLQVLQEARAAQQDLRAEQVPLELREQQVLQAVQAAQAQQVPLVISARLALKAQPAKQVIKA